MNMSLENLALDSQDNIVEKIQENGFDKIRCNLTGQVIAVIEPSILESAIGYLRFEQPFLTESQIIDQMQMRWIIQCSRPAPHLVSFQSHNAHTYMVNQHPRDMFALLYGKMLFEHEKIDSEMNPSDALKSKLFWLIQLQESDFFNAFSKAMRTGLDALIRLDAMHSIRKVFYSPKMRALASQIRDAIPTEKMLLTFLEEVESHSLQALTKRATPPTGNVQSLNAALAQAGILPWQIRIKENEARQKAESHAFAARVVETMALSKFEQIKAGYADKQTAVLADLEGQIPELLRQKYAAAEKADREEKAAVKNPKKSDRKVAKSSLKSAKRFGTLDFSL